MDDKKIARINELYKKEKEGKLTMDEEIEQAVLRMEFVRSFRQNLRSQLDNIDIQEPDGTIVNLGEKYGDKNKKGN